MPGFNLSRKRIIAIAVAALLCLVLFREAGLADLNLYKSKISTQFTASKSMSHSGGKSKQQSWIITIKNGDDAIVEQTILNGDADPIIVHGELDVSDPTGNYYVPLVKQFEMTCRLEYTGADEMDRASIDGKMDIEITAEIRGFCTRSKAKSLAIQEANECVSKYFNEQFQT